MASLVLDEQDQAQFSTGALVAWMSQSAGRVSDEISESGDQVCVQFSALALRNLDGARPAAHEAA